MRAFGFSLCWILRPRFSLFFFFSRFHAFKETDFTVQRQFLLFIHCFVTVHYCSSTIYTLKNIKNGSHDTFHTFKNYFVTVFSVFSFSNNKLNPNEPYRLTIWSTRSVFFFLIFFYHYYYYFGWKERRRQTSLLLLLLLLLLFFWVEREKETDKQTYRHREIVFAKAFHSI